MARRQIEKDPHAEREAARYENPIPSREFIRECLLRSERGLSDEQLRRALDIDGEEQEEGLRRRLKAMLRDGQIARRKGGRYQALEDTDGVEGAVQASRDGFGFVLVEGGEDIYLSHWQMQQVFDGDVVRAVVTGHDRRGRCEGRIVAVLQRNTRQLVGRYMVEDGQGYVLSDNPRLQQPVLVEPADSGAANVDDYVMVEITRQPGVRQQAGGRVVEILGDITVPGVATEVALREHDIPHQWPEAVEQQARGFDAEPAEEDKRGRVDLRQLPLVTIDGEDARDFDDAVYAERKRWGGWRLWVAIADVSHYVQVGSPLDVEAHLRGTSVYFPDRVVPMLPESLSNGLCSLKPEVDRLAMVCEMTISASGRLSGYRFYEGLIRSHARLTYNEVAALLEVEGSDPAKDSGRFHHLKPQLRTLHNLYKALRQARDKRGAIDFDTVETRVMYDREHRIDAIVPVVRNDAHKLIEECMLCANVATARLLERYKLEALYRVHQGPAEKKLASLREYLGELGLSLRGGDSPTPEDYQKLLQQVAGRPDAPVIQVMLLRSLSQAVYQPENEGHFGLHYAGYTHFTSPIRRYPDLLVHRAIRWLIRGTKGSKHYSRERGAPRLQREQIYPYGPAELVALGEHCSMVERRADDATRDVMAWLKCEFLQDRVGEEFDAVITAVTGFGLFVELEDLYIEGLVHISALDRDYFQFDSSRQRLIGEHSRQVFALGDEIRVQVLRVSVEERKIDLGLAGVLPSASQRRKSKSRGKGQGKASGAGRGRAEARAKDDQPAKAPRKRSRRRKK